MARGHATAKRVWSGTPTAPGGLVAHMDYTGNPATGVEIDDDEYHANWKPAKSASGAHLVVVTILTGDTLGNTKTLR